MLHFNNQSERDFWQKVYVASFKASHTVGRSEFAEESADTAVITLRNRDKASERLAVADSLVIVAKNLTLGKASANPGNFKIEAMRDLRNIANLDLKDAKTAVEYFCQNSNWPQELLDLLGL